MKPFLALNRPVRFGLPRLRGFALSLCCCCSTLFGIWGPLGTLGVATCEAQQSLRPRLFTTGSSLRGAFSEVTTSARQSIVEVRDGEKTVALGVIVGADGWVLTKGSELKPTIVCRLTDDQQYPATLIGHHDATDLALIKIEATNLTPIEWESSTNPEIGQWIVSPGMNDTPEAIGVVGSNRRKIARERIVGVLGVELEGENGPPRIRRVTEKSGAEVAGLQIGDLVVKIDGVDQSSRAAMIQEVRKHQPGDALKLSIRRGEEVLDVEVTLTPPPSDEFRSRLAIQNRMGGDLSQRRTGFESVIQHDSVLWPESIGGPAITLSGKAVGINIARAGRTETYALPADLVLPVIEELKLQAPSSVVSNE